MARQGNEGSIAPLISLGRCERGKGAGVNEVGWGKRREVKRSSNRKVSEK